jgi:hypothetical protein
MAKNFESPIGKTACYHTVTMSIYLSVIVLAVCLSGRICHCPPGHIAQTDQTASQVAVVVALCQIKCGICHWGRSECIKSQQVQWYSDVSTSPSMYLSVSLSTRLCAWPPDNILQTENTHLGDAAGSGPSSNLMWCNELKRGLTVWRGKRNSDIHKVMNLSISPFFPLFIHIYMSLCRFRLSV